MIMKTDRMRVSTSNKLSCVTLYSNKYGIRIHKGSVVRARYRPGKSKYEFCLTAERSIGSEILGKF